MNLFRAPFFLPWLYPQLTWRIETPVKELYLTFDDGPVRGPTEFVLHELQRTKAIATFFCIGENVIKHPDLFQEVGKAGHAVGNHTHNHLSGWKTSTVDYVSNIETCSQTLTHYSSNSALVPQGQGKGEGLFRPPYGRITRDQIKSLRDFKIVMWDVLTHDYAKGLSQRHCLNGSISATRPGSIIVFHDSLKAEKNMTYVLPRFIDHFAGLGYVFKSLP